MGPHRIRQVALTLGRWTAQLQHISRQFARQLNAELDAIDDDSVKNTYRDMRELQKEVQELRRELSSVPKSLTRESKAIVEEAEEAMGASSSTNKTRATEPGSDAAQLSSAANKSRLPKAIEVPGDPD